MKRYILAFDQSTQGTKSLLLDERGSVVARSDLPHRQIINGAGWVSHDPEEIYDNLVKTARQVTEKAGIRPGDVACIGISNQRETSVAWDPSGRSICPAIVWQCARATDICREREKSGIGDLVRAATGIPLSPYFPAAKYAWILRNVPAARELGSHLHLGTVDAYLLYRMTGGKAFKTDYSNASRTQLMNLHTLGWDREICGAFGIDAGTLPEITDSDAVFGKTTLEGLFPVPVPVCAMLGDSHAALFGQGCLTRGMAKATYGTGSSVMMHTGDTFTESTQGLVTSLAWKWQGRVSYVMEGNLNYTGAVISWLKDQVGLIESAAQTQELAMGANPADTTYLVPAFTGLGAPYWESGAKAVLCGMTRLTGKAEIVRAALDCIAYQIADIVFAMEKDTGIHLPVLRVDGGPTRNAYLMQMQADLLGADLEVPQSEELSAIGAGYMAGITAGILSADVFSSIQRTSYVPQMAEARRDEKYRGWKEAVSMVCSKA